MTDVTVLIAWDTCVVLDAIKDDAAWSPHIQPVIDDAEEGKVRILVSEVTVAEACKLSKDADEDVEECARLINAFFDRLFIERRPVDRRVSEKAAELIRNHNIYACDAMILATAIIHRARILYTRDGCRKDGKKKKGLLKLNRIDGLTIEPPNEAKYRNWPLFAQSKDDDE